MADIGSFSGVPQDEKKNNTLVNDANGMYKKLLTDSVEESL